MRPKECREETRGRLILLDLGALLRCHCRTSLTQQGYPLAMLSVGGGAPCLTEEPLSDTATVGWWGKCERTVCDCLCVCVCVCVCMCV